MMQDALAADASQRVEATTANSSRAQLPGGLPSSRRHRFFVAAASAVWLLCAACNSTPVNKGSAKHYQLTGRILSLNSKDQTASIDAAAIPNYMDAMTMTYPIASKPDFESLHAGDEIRATVNVYDSGDFDLSSIHKIAK